MSKSSKIDLNNPQYYFNRELSWLAFNQRVLHEAQDSSNPLLEQVKFLAISCSNLDEFFMVRVSTLKEQVQADNLERTPDGLTAQMQLAEIERVLRPMMAAQHSLFEQTLRPELSKAGIALPEYTDLNQDQRSHLKNYFHQRIFPILTPLVVDPSHPFPAVSNLSLNLAVSLKDIENNTKHFARVKVPDLLPRFLELPSLEKALGKTQEKTKEKAHKKSSHSPQSHPASWTGIPIEQVIGNHLGTLFPGMVIQQWCVFRLTRDGDFPVKDQETQDLRLAVQTEISKRRLHGEVIRLEIHTSMSEWMRQMLIQGLELSTSDLYEIDGLLTLKDLMALTALPFPTLKNPPWAPVLPNWASTEEIEQPEHDLFSTISARDRFVHHPYESFTASVQQFINQAADDPQVLAIKITLYRTSGDSEIAQALIRAAQRGKQAVALIELKARFDEENNINWADRLEDAGVHVVYGILGLKTHTKVALVVRQEGEQLRRYVHVGTGNYNRKTAKLYTDVGLFSAREDLGADLTDLFNYLTGRSRQANYRKILVAPINIRSKILHLIKQEIEQANQNQPAKIIAKMNALVDAEIIQHLYKASQAGVQIDLIVRGSCCLRPGIKDISENIRVISIVGRFLEHSRIFYFENNGHAKMFIGSADWMPRNLDKRVEAIAPIEDADIQQQLGNILNTLLNDNCKAWELQPSGEYIQRQPGPTEQKRSAQTLLIEAAKTGKIIPS
jgi:polyphosphate kinase